MFLTMVQTLSEVFTTYQEDVRQRILKRFREFVRGLGWTMLHWGDGLGVVPFDLARAFGQQKTNTFSLQCCDSQKRTGRSITGMMRWLVSIASLILVNGANLEVSEQDGILKLLTASESPAAVSDAKSNVSKTSKVKAKTTQMEDMVLLLAQQAKAAREASKDKGDEEDLKDLLTQLRAELVNMQKEINAAASQSDSACQAAFDNLTAGCAVFGNDTLFYPDGGSSRVIGVGIGKR
eukprot:symbB.v1.2.021623.t1/scaffold1876.1/size97432/4